MCVRCAWRFQGSISFSSSNPRPSSLFSTQPAQPPSCNLLHWAKLHCNHSKLEYIIACRLNLCWRESARQNWPSRWLFHLRDMPLLWRKKPKNILCRSWTIKAKMCPGSHVGYLFKLMTPLIFLAPLTGFSSGSYLVSAGHYRTLELITPPWSTFCNNLIWKARKSGVVG